MVALREAVGLSDVVFLLDGPITLSVDYPARYVIGSEVVNIVGGKSTAAVSVVRGVESTTITTHAKGATLTFAPDTSGTAAAAAASAISYDPAASGLSSVNVQAALNELVTTRPDIRLAESLRAKSLRQYHRGLAHVASAPVNIVCIGDSITEGLDATAIGASGTRYVDKLRDRLRTRWNPAGVTGGAGYLPIYQPYVTSSWSAVTAGSDLVAHGLGYKACVFSAGGHTATLAFTGTGLDIIYCKGAGYGNFTWAIDGGGATSIPENAADADGFVVQIRSLANSAHTLVLARDSGATIIDGAYVYRGDEAAGIRVWEAGHGGMWAANTQGLSRIYWQQVVHTIQPDLVTICFGLNEYSGNLTPASMQVALTSMIADIRAQCTVSPSIVLMVPHMRGDVVSPTYPWSQYVAAIYATAAADGYAGVLDLGLRFDNDALTSYHASVALTTAANKTHPTDLGHSLIANALVGYLEP